MLSKGVLQADLFIHHPMVEYYLKAVRCCLLECEGFQSGFGHALTQTSNGFIGLEDIKSLIIMFYYEDEEKKNRI